MSEDQEAYGPDNPLSFTDAEVMLAASVETRLKRFPEQALRTMMRAGYAHADAVPGRAG